MKRGRTGSTSSSEAGGEDKRDLGESGPGLGSKVAVFLGHLNHGLDSGLTHPPHSGHR